MSDHTIALISLLVSVAAFVCGGYSLWITRKDRKFKHHVLQDNEIAKPLLKVEVVSSLITNDDYLRHACFDIAVEISFLGIVFRNNDFNVKLYGLIKTLMYLAREHPARHPNFIEQDGKYLSGSNSDFKEVYYNDVDDWFHDWREFIHELKLYLALKDS